MYEQISAAGAATEELRLKAHQWWVDEARKSGVNLSSYDYAAPLSDRISWAKSIGLLIAAILSRYSSKLQHSTDAQVQQCVEYAARHGFYVAPEFICVDEAITGRRTMREGLERIKAILHHHLADVLLVFKVSRLLRVGYKGFQFVQENVVDEGLRAVSVSQGIDTAEEKTWRSLAYLHGLMDDLLLDTIADHCRAGLRSLFLQGYTTGALPVGYQPVKVPGAPLTKRGLPRTMPGVVAEHAALIRQHYEWIRDGMTLREGWRRWRAAGGPCDPRSSFGYMSYKSYRRMLSNPRYRGCWAFGQRRNRWVSKREYTRQVKQPESEVAILQCEELRIVEDELFFAVQERLAGLELGPRGPHKQRDLHLWDFTTELFHCARCRVRFYQAGGHGKGMRCKHADLCPCLTVVNRQEAVQALCRKLAKLIENDHDMITTIMTSVQQIDALGDEPLQKEIDALELKIVGLANKIDDLEELAGQGSVEDRRRRRGKAQAAISERMAAQAEMARLRKKLDNPRTPITAETVNSILNEFTTLLEDGASGKLGSDVIFKAASVFRRLVGGRIMVHVEPRPGRKGKIVKGTFVPQLLQSARSVTELPQSAEDPCSSEVEVWLRQPPKLDRLAFRVHELIDIEGLSYRAAATKLQQEGEKVNSGNVWNFYRRYYEVQGLVAPKRPYNNGRPRKRA